MVERQFPDAAEVDTKQTEGEIAGASAAAAAGITFSLSTLGTTSIEDVKLLGLAALGVLEPRHVT